MLANQDQSNGDSAIAPFQSSLTRTARFLAFYLPQFHPIPENDRWWGPGFTEWTNVAKAKPLFRGHVQPRLPADLGFYDLRVPEVRQKQADLALNYGLEGFIYWHYWFGNGRRILERPFAEVLESGEPNFPFCLAWANQSWTGIWHGNPKSILIEQTYPGPQDDEAHFAAIEAAFHDPRYVTVDGKPLFIMFDPGHHPDPPGFVDLWRKLAQASGLPGLHLVAMWNKALPPLLDSFDGVAPFGPGDFLESLSAGPWRQRLANAMHGNFGDKVHRLTGFRNRSPRRYEYVDVVHNAFRTSAADDPRFVPTIVPNWDNTPRSGNRGLIFERSSPELFIRYIQKGLSKIETRQFEKRLVFLKAWNEWAEGNYLEPDNLNGHALLDALASCALRSQG